MLPPRSWRVLTAALLAATLGLTLSPAGATSSLRDDGTITGADGVEYPRAPGAVQGRSGDLFDGYTFDIICSDGGAGLTSDIKRLGKLAKLIERSGRTVAFTVVPPKALVNVENVVRGRLPHGRCDKKGLDQQRAVYDSYADPRFIRLRQMLEQDKRQMFWKTDPHWTTLGAFHLVREIAERVAL